MSKAPAFQFYANDFMDATSMWEANAVGLYVRCLCKQWTHGSIPADLKILARAIHCDRPELESCWEVLGPKFIDQGDGTLKNNRLEEVRDRQSHVSEERSKAGRAGAIAKANAKANASTNEEQRKVKEKEKEKVEGEEEGNEVRTRAKVETDPHFESLWTAYERYGAKAKAYAYWQKLTLEDRAAIIAKAPDYVKSTPGCEYRKQLEGWINPDNRLWERPIVQRKGSAMQVALHSADVPPDAYSER